jgi:hypothetical protein
MVEEGTYTHYTMYLGRDHRPSASKPSNFLTHSKSVRAWFEPTVTRSERLVVWDLFLLFLQLYDGGHFLLVEERTHVHYIMYLGRDLRPSTSKLTNFLTHSDPSEQDSNRRWLVVRDLVVWDRWFKGILSIIMMKILVSQNNFILCRIIF